MTILQMQRLVRPLCLLVSMIRDWCLPMMRYLWFVMAAAWVVSVPVAAGSPSPCDTIEFGSCDGSPPCDAYLSGCGQASAWMATFDVMFLHRSDPKSGVLAFNTTDPSQNLNANDFDFGTEAGIDFSLARSLNNGNVLEVRYFGIDDWDSSLATATTANDLLQFNAAVPIFATAGDAITSNYASELQNVELNLSREVRDWLAVGAGFRFLELEEFGSASLVGAAVPFDYAVATRNRLYGAQAGAQALLYGGDLVRLDVVGKAGIYGNDAEHRARANTNVATITAAGDDSRTAFVGEIGINGVANLTANLSVRGGYRLLWVDSVALASDQLAASDFFTGAGIDGSGSVFYQGAFVGLELTR